jgi:hypothetical protein
MADTPPPLDHVPPLPASTPPPSLKHKKPKPAPIEVPVADVPYELYVVFALAIGTQYGNPPAPCTSHRASVAHHCSFLPSPQVVGRHVP